MSIAFLFAVNGDENSRHLYSSSSPFNSQVTKTEFLLTISIKYQAGK